MKAIILGEFNIDVAGRELDKFEEFDKWDMFYKGS